MLETQTDTKPLNLNGEEWESKAGIITRSKSTFRFLVTLSRNACLNTGRTARRRQGAWLPVTHPSVSAWDNAAVGGDGWGWAPNPPCDGLKCQGGGCGQGLWEDSERGLQRNTWIKHNGPDQVERAFCCCTAVEDRGRWSWSRYSLGKPRHTSSSVVLTLSPCGRQRSWSETGQYPEWPPHWEALRTVVKKEIH